MARTTCKLKLVPPSELTMGSADTLLSWKMFKATMIGVSGHACGRKEQAKGKEREEGRGSERKWEERKGAESCL